MSNFQSTMDSCYVAIIISSSLQAGCHGNIILKDCKDCSKSKCIYIAHLKQLTKVLYNCTGKTKTITQNKWSTTSTIKTLTLCCWNIQEQLINSAIDQWLHSLLSHDWCAFKLQWEYMNRSWTKWNNVICFASRLQQPVDQNRLKYWKYQLWPSRKLSHSAMSWVCIAGSVTSCNLVSAGHPLPCQQIRCGCLNEEHINIMYFFSFKCDSKF